MGRCLSKCLGKEDEPKPEPQQYPAGRISQESHYNKSVSSIQMETFDANTSSQDQPQNTEVPLIDGVPSDDKKWSEISPSQEEAKIDQSAPTDTTQTESPSEIITSPVKVSESDQNTQTNGSAAVEIDLGVAARENRGMSQQMETVDLLDDEEKKRSLSMVATDSSPKRSSITPTARPNSQDPKPLILQSVDESDELHHKFIQQSHDALAKVLETNNSEYSEDYEKIYEEKKEDHKLKIYLSSYMTPEKNRVNKVRAEWYVPVTPEQFIGFMNNVEEQWKVDDGTMEKFYPVSIMNAEEESGYVVYYLSYKKQMVASARDMIYIKHYKKLDDDTYADASVSVEHPDFPEVKNYVRCEFKAGGNIIKLVSGKEDGKPVSFIRMSSESDFKTNVPLFMAKSFTNSSLKGYIERCIKSLKTLHPHQA